MFKVGFRSLNKKWTKKANIKIKRYNTSKTITGQIKWY